MKTLMKLVGALALATATMMAHSQVSVQIQGSHGYLNYYSPERHQYAPNHMWQAPPRRPHYYVAPPLAPPPRHFYPGQRVYPEYRRPLPVCYEQRVIMYNVYGQPESVFKTICQ